MLQYILYILLGYLSGSVLYGYLFLKIFRKEDITKLSDDGNPGTANAYKYGGFWIGTATLLCELMKGIVPVVLASRFLDTGNILFALVMAAPVFGHAFPVYRCGKEAGVKGGKSIAVTFGVLIGLAPEVKPLAILIAFYLLFSLAIKIYTHVYRSIVTFAFFFAGCLALVEDKVIVLGCLLNSALVIARHFARWKNEHFCIVFLGKEYHYLKKG